MFDSSTVVFSTHLEAACVFVGAVVGWGMAAAYAVRWLASKVLPSSDERDCY